MKQWSYLVSGLMLGLLLLPATTFAHTYRADGPIRVLLHTDPDDNPLAGDQTQLNFYVFDDQNQFLGSHCSCFLTVTGNGKTILNQKIFTDAAADKNVAAVPVVFPQLGIYSVTLSGHPKKGFNFHAFSLNYSVRVDQEGAGSGSGIGGGSILANGLKIGLAYALAAIAIVAIIVVSTRGDRKKRPASASPQHRKSRKH